MNDWSRADLWSRRIISLLRSRTAITPLLLRISTAVSTLLPGETSLAAAATVSKLLLLPIRTRSDIPTSATRCSRWKVWMRGRRRTGDGSTARVVPFSQTMRNGDVHLSLTSCLVRKGVVEGDTGASSRTPTEKRTVEVLSIVDPGRGSEAM